MTDALVLVLVVMGIVNGARAHPVQFAVARLTERATGRVSVSLEYSGSEDEPTGGRLTVSRCRDVGAREEERTPLGSSTRWQMDCGPRGLDGAELRLVGARGVQLLVDLRRRDGSALRQLVTEDEPRFVIPPRGAAETSVLGRYVALGVEHILLGIDHLLFVLCLLLLHRTTAGSTWDRARRLTATITAFTAGHSVTLALATLGVVNVPSAPVEAVIALSIVLLAAEVARNAGDGRATIARRRPWVVAGSFGLLHGLGFAGALSEVGLPEGDVPLALLGFNVGVEIGQLAFVACALVAGAIAGRIVPSPRAGERAARGVAYATGAIAVHWCIERVTAFWA